MSKETFRNAARGAAFSAVVLFAGTACKERTTPSTEIIPTPIERPTPTVKSESGVIGKINLVALVKEAQRTKTGIIIVVTEPVDFDFTIKWTGIYKTGEGVGEKEEIIQTVDQKVRDRFSGLPPTMFVTFPSCEGKFLIEISSDGKTFLPVIAEEQLGNSQNSPFFTLNKCSRIVGIKLPRAAKN